MSGDSAGVIGVLFGLGVVIAAAPVIIAGAAAVGVGYAAYRVGGVAAAKAKEQKQLRDLEIKNCSNQLESMYGSINRAISRINRIQREYDETVSKNVSELSREIENITFDKDNADEFAEKLKSSRNKLEQAFAYSTSETEKKVVGELKSVVKNSSDALAVAQMQQKNLVNWSSKLAADVANQQAVATIALKDAKATVDLILSLRNSSGNADLCEQADVLNGMFEKMNSCYSAGLYETALSNANTIITQGAVIAAEFALDEYEKTQARYELESRLVMHQCELEKRRCFTVEYEGEAIDIDLDEFSQGLYAKAQAEIFARLRNLRKNGGQMSLKELHIALAECDVILTDRNHTVSVSQIVDVAIEKMRLYYEKLAVMDIIAEYMMSQGYCLEWACNAADDKTQKLVVSFSNHVTKNTVSVTIDTEGTIGDFCNYAMELAYYYDNNRPVTEKEKDKLRSQLNAELKKRGISGALICSGRVDLPSEKTELQTEQDVLNISPVSIYNEE